MLNSVKHSNESTHFLESLDTLRPVLGSHLNTLWVLLLPYGPMSFENEDVLPISQDEFALCRKVLGVCTVSSVGSFNRMSYR